MRCVGVRASARATRECERRGADFRVRVGDKDVWRAGARARARVVRAMRVVCVWRNVCRCFVMR